MPRSRNLSIELPFTLDNGREVSLDISLHYYPGSPDVYYLPNGDPGYPGDPSEIEFLAIKDAETNEILFLTETEEEKLRLEVETHLDENADSYFGPPEE